jgi:cytochrome c
MRPRSWFAATPLLFLMGGLGLSVHAADPDLRTSRGIFERRCSGCHAPDINKGGPRLRGVLNRKAGTVEGFPYSDALRKSGIKWDEKLLKQWIENPDSIVKDNAMEFRVANADERVAIIAYLESLTK